MTTAVSESSKASPFRTLVAASGDALSAVPAGSVEALVLSTRFDPGTKRPTGTAGALPLSNDSQALLAAGFRVLKAGGLLFVYGLPEELPRWGERLLDCNDASGKMVFKHWIALDLDAAPRAGSLKPSHLGLLLFWKSKPGARPAPKFQIHTNAVRIPHALCAACGRSLKDWGGKKHLMHPMGAAISDVWRQLPRRRLRDSILPDDVLERVAAMSPGVVKLHVIQTTQPAMDRSGTVDSHPCFPAPPHKLKLELQPGTAIAQLSVIEPDTVYEGDCVAFLDQVAALHPRGLFDLAFADPPYNLQKSYDRYADELAEREYLAWCNRWLAGMARALKPGGSLFVLNLPKWALHHAAFLNGLLEFRHWIAWDALSDPRGKIMPAHYALLWYAKPGGPPVCNYAPSAARTGDNAVLPPDAPKYCLRAACIRDRKARGEDGKVELSDVWFDVHRIKHKRDRDAHPCQLPEKLMERIIRLTTHRGGWVFDPFCGAGTTAIAAAKLGRRFVVSELDSKYVRITREKLTAMRTNADLFGQFTVLRTSVRCPRLPAGKREIELYLQGLARKLNRLPAENDIAADDAAMLRKIDAIYPNRGAALKRAKVALGAVAAPA